MILLIAMELVIIGLTYSRLAHLAELADSGGLAAVTRWVFIAHIVTVSLWIMSFFCIDTTLVTLVLLSMVAMGATALWTRYMALLWSIIDRD